jgi:flagellar hook protein FlgE
LDVAIEGSGYFVVEGREGEQLYSRAGIFRVDEVGDIRNQNGLRVLGFSADGNGQLEPLNVRSTDGGSVPTTEVELRGNLDSSSPIAPAIPAGPGLSLADYNEDAAFSTSFEVIDSLGESHDVSVFFYRGPNAPGPSFEARAVIDGGEVGGVDGDAVEIGAGTISFDNNGLQSALVPASDITINPAFSNGADVGNTTLSFEGFTSFAAQSSLASIVQNGSITGTPNGVTVADDGQLRIQLDNGEEVTAGTIAIANFNNPQGLNPEGASLFSSSANSGEAAIGEPGTASFGSLQGGALEGSSVDFVTEFVNIKAYEAQFKASAKLTKTLSDLEEEIINIA